MAKVGMCLPDRTRVRRRGVAPEQTAGRRRLRGTRPADTTIKPYVYEANVTSVRDVRPGRQAVTFENIR